MFARSIQDKLKSTLKLPEELGNQPEITSQIGSEKSLFKVYFY